MKIKLHIIIFIFSFSSIILAQSELSGFNSQLIKNGQIAKFDEFGDLKEKEIKPKFERFEKYLRENKNLQGFVVFYGNLNESLFRQSSFFANRKIEKLSSFIHSNRLGAPQVNYIFGGLKTAITIELWVSPKGQSPIVSSLAEPPKNIRYRLELLGKQYLKFNSNEYYEDLSELKEESDSSDITNNYLEIFEEPESKDSFKELAEVLNRDETWKAVLFFYFDDEKFDIQKAHQIIKSHLESNMKNLKLDMNRVKITYGGYRSTPETEIWVINKNGVEPEAMPDERFKVELND